MLKSILNQFHINSNPIHKINKKVLIPTIITLFTIILLNIPILYQTIGNYTCPRFSIISSLQTDMEEKQFCTPYFIYHSIIGYNTNNQIQSDNSIINTNTTTNNTKGIQLTTQCDIVQNYDNTVIIEYKGQQYKCYVKDGTNYNSSSTAIVTFNTQDLNNLKTYSITNIKPV